MPLNHPPPPSPSPPALAAFPRAAFAPTAAPVDFVCMRDGRARRFVLVVVVRLVGAECAAGVSCLPAAPPTGLGEVPAQKVIGG
jgi:hypothetical protein